MGRDPTSLCVSRVFSLLNYDGGVCDNTGWYSRPLAERETGEDEKEVPEMQEATVQGSERAVGDQLSVLPQLSGKRNNPVGPSKVPLRGIR